MRYLFSSYWNWSKHVNLPSAQWKMEIPVTQTFVLKRKEETKTTNLCLSTLFQWKYPQRNPSQHIVSPSENENSLKCICANKSIFWSQCILIKNVRLALKHETFMFKLVKVGKKDMHRVVSQTINHSGSKKRKILL